MPAFAFKNGKLVRRATAPVTSCHACGACCMYQGRPPLSSAEEESLPLRVRLSLVTFDADVLAGRRPPPGKKAAQLKTGRVGFTPFAEADLIEPCLWLDTETKECRNYTHRPAVCREFVVGGKECLTTRREFRVPLPMAS